MSAPRCLNPLPHEPHEWLAHADAGTLSPCAGRTEPADRRDRYAEAIKGALPLTNKAIDAAMAVADAEIQEATELAAGLGLQNMRLKAALAQFHCTACGGEGGGGTEDPDVWIPCDTCHGTGLHTALPAVLREQAHEGQQAGESR